ncbi:MAG: hypothetical protein ABW221_14290 [Vicinamibacteria bacterium]
MSEHGIARRFFVPFAPGVGDDESVYLVIRSAVRRRTGRTPGERRVRRLSYTLDGRTCQSVVGEHDGRTGETILAIFECAGAYLVCTRTHGLAGGPPVHVDGTMVVEAEDFG